MNTLDDPIVQYKTIDYKVFKANKNIILGTNRHGGHLGYHEHIFSMSQWFMTPVMDFFDTFLDDKNIIQSKI